MTEDFLAQKPYVSPDLIINGRNFGRGHEDADEKSNVNTKFKTVEIKIWRIVDDKLEALEKDVQKNVFYDEENYLVLWNIKISDAGKEKIYFHWKGDKASKGYSPLPEEIEKDFPPVERIVQWAEPPAFLNLFEGKFLVNKGKHGSFDKNSSHLYILRGELENEVHLCELEAIKKNLRSRTCFLLYNPLEKKDSENSVIIWHGVKSSARSRKMVRIAADKIFPDNKVKEIIETFENKEFLMKVEGDADDYCRDIPKMLKTPRLFYFSSITGTLAPVEVLGAQRNPTYITPFPFLQSHLLTAEQPAIFFIDDGESYWMWHGWKTDDEEKNLKIRTDFKAARKMMQSCPSSMGVDSVKIVFAGVEPPAFTNLFPAFQKRRELSEKLGFGDIPFL